MKNYVSILVISSILTIFLLSCSEDDEGPMRNLDGDPSGAVINATVVDYNENELIISLDIYVVDGRGNFTGGLSAANFTIEDAYIGYYGEVSFENTQVSSAKTSAKGNYSATLLLDQSGSISSTDPNDLRIEAAKIFSGALGDNDYALVSSFTTRHAPYDVLYYGIYTQDTTELYSHLDNLLNQEGGYTPLYKATYAMIDYTADNAPGNNKAIILFTDGKDTNRGYSLEEVTDHANNNNIQIYTVGLSRSVELDVLAKLADNTEGAFMWAENARQLITMFGTLGDLLSGNAQYYRTSWKAVRANGNWTSGSSFVAEVTITLSDGSEFLVPFQITIP